MMSRSQPLLVAPIDFEWWRPNSAEWADRTAIWERLPRWGVTAYDDWCIETRHGTITLKPETTWLIAEAAIAYQPLLEYPALFREFAALPVDRHAYRAFAEQYGPLERRGFAELPESPSDWVLEHLLLRFAVRLYEALASGQTDDLDALGVRIVDPQPGTPTAPPQDCYSAAHTFANDDDVADLLAQTSHSDRELAHAVRRYSAQDRVAVAIVPDMDSRTIVQTMLSSLLRMRLDDHVAKISIRPGSSSLGIGLESSVKIESLIGALWLQLTFAALGNRTYRSCPVCGKWWDATDARSHKAVCSDNCRAKRSYRERKAAKEEAAETDESS